MDKYYYLVSQLPLISFNKETQIKIEYFLEQARKWLSQKDYRILSLANLDSYELLHKGNSALSAVRQFENQLRTDVAKWREAQKKDLDYKPKTFSASLLKEGTPLDVEVKLLQLRWDFIDEMEREHHFDLAFIILYYLKLQILRRLFTFNKEKGLNKFQKLYEVNV